MPLVRFVKILTTSALALCALMVPALAEAGHGKVDRVLKRNGDQITCEIVSLLRGLLKVKTDGMGTIDIEWNQTVGVTSPAQYEVEVSSGLRYFGALSTPTPGKLAVSGAPPGTLLDFVEVVKMGPIDQSFWRQLDGSIDLGYTFTQADQRSQWSFNAGLTRTTRRFITRFSANSLITFEDSGTRQNRNTVSLGVQRQLPERWFAVVFGQVDQNEQLNLDFRGLGGAGIGRNIVQTNRVVLSPFAGLTYTQERYVDEPILNLAEAAIGARLDWFTFGDYKTDLVVSEQTYIDVKDASRVRVELTTNLRQEVVKDLYLSLNLLESFNAAPPSNNKKNDLTLSMSLGWSF